jgi:hypothetical protein
MRRMVANWTCRPCGPETGLGEVVRIANGKSACKKRSRLLPVDDLAGNNADWLRNHSITISQDRERHYGQKCQSSYRIAWPLSRQGRGRCSVAQTTGISLPPKLRISCSPTREMKLVFRVLREAVRIFL